MLGIENATLFTAQDLRALCSRKSGMARILEVLKLFNTFNQWCLPTTEMLKPLKTLTAIALGSPAGPQHQRLLETHFP